MSNIRLSLPVQVMWLVHTHSFRSRRAPKAFENKGYAGYYMYAMWINHAVLACQTKPTTLNLSSSLEPKEIVCFFILHQRKSNI